MLIRSLLLWRVCSSLTWDHEDFTVFVAKKRKRYADQRTKGKSLTKKVLSDVTCSGDASVVVFVFGVMEGIVSWEGHRSYSQLTWQTRGFTAVVQPISISAYKSPVNSSRLCSYFVPKRNGSWAGLKQARKLLSIKSVKNKHLSYVMSTETVKAIPVTSGQSWSEGKVVLKGPAFCWEYTHLR